MKSIRRTLAASSPTKASEEREAIRRILDQQMQRVRLGSLLTTKAIPKELNRRTKAVG